MNVTIGVASLLKGKERVEVLRFWDMFESDYNSVGVRSFDHPNLGFQGGTCANIEPLKKDLRELCEHLSPFEVIVDGFGFFESHSKIVYMRVHKTKELIEVHKKIHSILGNHCDSLFNFYTPENWVPHITLAMDDLTEEGFEDFKIRYKNHTPSFKQTMTNLALVEFRPNGRVDLVQSFAL